MAENNSSSRRDYGPIFNALSRARVGDNSRLNEEVVSAFLAFDSSLAPVSDVARASLIEKCLDFYCFRLGDVFQLTLLNEAFEIYSRQGMPLDASRCAYAIAAIHDDNDNCPEVLIWTDRVIEGGSDYAGIVSAYQLQINCLTSAKRFEGAFVSLASYLELINKYGSGSPGDLVVHCLIKASVYYEQERLNESLACYSEALRYLKEGSPHRPFIMYNKGAVLARSGFLEEAKLLMEGARSLWRSIEYRSAFPSYASDLDELSVSDATEANLECPEPLGYWCFVRR